MSASVPARPKPNLTIRWSKREKALLYNYQSNAGKALGGVLSGVLERITLGEMNGDVCGEECSRNGVSARIRNSDRRRGVPDDPAIKRTLAQELEARGYDLTTLRFSICKKASASET